MKRHLTGVAAIAACLAVPAAAAAHPSVYRVVAKVAPAGNTAPTEGQLVDQVRYAVNNDGWAYALRETNGRLGGGMVNYALLPSAFRTSQLPSKQQWLDPKYVSDVQPHATCNVASLNDKATILSWQTDPFFDYVPWQATSAGFGDDPAKWLPVVQQKTGVNLAAVADLAKACTDIGGTYVKADEVQTSAASFVGEYVASFVDPLEARVATLEAEATTMRSAAQTMQAEIARLTAANRPLTLTARASVKCTTIARSGLPLRLDGPPGLTVNVTLTMSDYRARKFGLKSGFLGQVKGTTGGDYNLGVTLKPTRKAAAALLKAKFKGRTRSVRATLEATSGDRFARKTIKLVA